MGTPKALAGSDTMGARSRAADARQPEQQQPSVLLVEDDRALRRYLEVVLRRGGYSVRVAADGLEAIKIALSEKVSAVVSDVVMPRLGGRELCRVIRARPELAGLPVVLLSGLTANEDEPDASDAADARLTKPVNADELLACLRRLIDRAG